MLSYVTIRLLLTLQNTKIKMQNLLFESMCRGQNEILITTFTFLHREDNIVGKVENAGYQHFLLLSQRFSVGLFLRCAKVRDNVLPNDNF